MIDSGIPPDELIQSINTHIRESGNHGHGDDILFFPMPALPVDLEATVYPLLSCGEERREALRAAAEDMIRGLPGKSGRGGHAHASAVAVQLFPA